MTESLTKEERIQLSTRWPPDTKLYLKLLRVHDAAVQALALLEDHSVCREQQAAEVLRFSLENQ